jgi:hypothetical protein
VCWFADRTAPRRSRVGILGGQHVIYDAGKFMSGCCDRCWCAQSPLHLPVKLAEIILGPVQAVCAEAQCNRRTVLHLSRARGVYAYDPERPEISTSINYVPKLKSDADIAAFKQRVLGKYGPSALSDGTGQYWRNYSGSQNGGALQRCVTPYVAFSNSGILSLNVVGNGRGIYSIGKGQSGNPKGTVPYHQSRE